MVFWFQYSQHPSNWREEEFPSGLDVMKAGARWQVLQVIGAPHDGCTEEAEEVIRQD